MTGQECAESEDEEDNDSGDALMCTDSSEYSLGGKFEENLSDSETSVSDHQIDRGFSDSRQTIRRLDRFPYSKPASILREIGAATTAEMITRLGLG